MFLEVKSTYKPVAAPPQDAAVKGRLCTWCSKEKPPIAFTERPQNKSGWSKRCKECQHLRDTGQFTKPGAKILAVSGGRTKTATMQQCRSHNLDPWKYRALLQKQRGLCAICKQKCVRGVLSIDHEHSTGIVRGLLCRVCNSGLGMFQDSPRLLRAAAKYIEKQGLTE